MKTSIFFLTVIVIFSCSNKPHHHNITADLLIEDNSPKDEYDSHLKISTSIETVHLAEYDTLSLFLVNNSSHKIIKKSFNHGGVLGHNLDDTLILVRRDSNEFVISSKCPNKECGRLPEPYFKYQKERVVSFDIRTNLDNSKVTYASSPITIKHR